MKERVLLVGCGEIGSRHLQAIASLSEVREIEIVDVRPEALQLGKERLQEVSDLNPSIKFRWLTSLKEATPLGGLCIIATQAKGRFELVQRVVEELGHRSFLLEKIVTQSVREYKQLLSFAEGRGLSVWVNCKTRAYPFHKKAREHFEPSESIQFSVIAGNYGLATSAIHIVDLFFFYDRSKFIVDSWSHIDPVLHPSKRGKELFELSGSIHAYSEKGSHLVLSFAQSNLASPCYMVASPRYRFFLDQFECERLAYESNAISNWDWQAVSFEGNLLISNMSRAFVKDILMSGQCELPTLEECYPAHAFLLKELQPHFNALLGKNLDYCPVT